MHERTPRRRPTGTRGRISILAAAALVAASVGAQSPRELEEGFRSPPDACRPWVYWFWLNGNITREGITADLEAMRRVGIGGVLIMEVDQGAPLGPVSFLGTEWRELFRHVVSEASRLGLEVNMNNDAGWNGSGGPWIRPEQSMQKVVWSETSVEGPGRFAGSLPQPETIAGHYRDIAVLAFPSPGPYRIAGIQVKAGFQVGGAGPADATVLPAEMTIDRKRVIDLSARMGPDGRIGWDVPPGSWTLLRFGHTSTGVENAPSPASGRGLECDKLSKEGIEANFAGMMAKLIADNGPAAGTTLAATHIDSWENGAQNWTPRMREEFLARRGYDLLGFLPTLTGRVVDSLEVSERFLWDLRQVISDLVVENYAGHLRALARQHGLRLSIEAYGGPCDDLPYAGRADEPMCEFWIGGGAMQTCKAAASAAHIYGKPIVGAEAFTAGDQERWRDHPATIKALGDLAFLDGVNRFVFHRYALQPWLDRRPGMTMGPWGTHYERTQTWWEWTPGWHRYLSRCQFLLRQGLFVADVCYLQPEAAPQGFQAHRLRGHDYDNVSAEVVLGRMEVKDHRLVLPGGMSYGLLVLPEDGVMTPALLRKIRDLVAAGATVLGPPPRKAPGLSDYPKCDEEVRRLAEELWGASAAGGSGERTHGLGRVVWGESPERALARAGVGPDFSSRARLRAIHRAAGDRDLYFVANPNPHDVVAPCAFRVAGKIPALWRPETGRVEPAAMYVEKDGITSVPLTLGPSESVFVVFSPAPGGPGSKPDPVVSVSRDGKPLLVAAEIAPRMVVKKAVYGVPGDAERTIDVRDRIQAMVDAGELDIRVARLAESGDPAARVVKTLTVDYEIGGRTFTVQGDDPDTVHLTGESARIVIEKATYGVPGDAQRTRDVRAKLQHLIDTGEVSFEVARMAQGDDPAFLVVKTLVVEYSIDGRRLVATGTDPDTIVLVPSEAAERGCEVRVGSDGRVALETWAPGTYEITTASGRSRAAEVKDLPPAVEVAGPWQVRFPAGQGAPESIVLERLASLSEHPEAGVRYFSGTAEYSTSFDVPAGMPGDGRRLLLDLGEVAVMAEVTLNGTALDVAWKRPFRLDVTDAIRPGRNALQVKVVNLWPNRLVGDEQLPEDSERNPDGTLKSWPAWLAEGKPSPTGRLAFTTWRLWRKGDPVLPSGLIGPVRLVPVATVALE